MPTTVTKTIGTAGGRDYSTLQSWEDAAPANLVTSDQIWRGECYNDSAFTAGVTISGSTSDATRYKELTAAAGQSFVDHSDRLTNPLTYNQAKGVGVSGSFSYGRPLIVSEANARVSRIQFRNTATSGQALQVDGTPTTFKQCIFDAAGSAAALLNGSAATVENTLFVLRKNGQTYVVNLFGTSNTIANCTVVVPSNITKATNAFQRAYTASTTLTNVAAFGVTNVWSNGTGFTAVNCFTDASSPPSGWTNVAYDTSTGSGFEGTVNASGDWRIKSTSALKEAGTSTGAPGVDIVGTTRPQGSLYDVGAWEHSSAGSSPTLTTSLSVAIQQAQALTAGLSAAVQLTPTASSSANLAVQAARTAQAGLDLAVQQARTGVASVQLAVQAAGLQSAGLDAALQLARSATTALDLAVQAQASATAAVSLQVQAGYSASASLNLQVQSGSSTSVALSVAVLQQALATAGLNLVVQTPGAATAGVSAALQAARTAAAAVDLALQAARSTGASVNLQVQAGTSLSAVLDVAVQQARSAVASVQLAIAQTASASLSLGAAVMVQRSVAAAVDALVQGGRLALADLSVYVHDGSLLQLAPGRRRVVMPDVARLQRSVQMPSHAALRRSVALYPA